MESPSSVDGPRPAKKRRSFFSSSLALPQLPTLTTTRPPVASRSQVLAALSAPEEATPASSRPRREAKQKVIDAGAGAGSGTSADQTGDQAPVDGGGPTARPKRTSAIAKPTPPTASPSSVNDSLPRSSSARSLRQRSSKPSQSAAKNAIASATSKDASTPNVKGKGKAAPAFFKSPSYTNAFRNRKLSISGPSGKASKDASKSSVSKNLLFAPPKAKGPAPTKMENAQNINERLSQMMMQSMRATIGGREETFARVPVWRDNHTKRKGKNSRTLLARLAAPIAPPPKRAFALTARQKAKQKAKDEDEAAIGAGLAEDAEQYEDIEEEVQEPKGTPKKDKGKGKAKDQGGPSKKYMNSGFYCQDANAKSPYKLVNQVLSQNGSSSKGGARRKSAQTASNPLLPGKHRQVSFPPLPYDHGYDHFFGKEHDFVLPYNIHKEATNGALNEKKKPAPYQKLRGNAFPERPRMTAEKAVCKCDPDSGCGDNCINRIMSYLCGKDCPCGEACTNRSLAKRPMKEAKVKYTGTRGFGLFAAEDIAEGDFVIDYRGEVISLDEFHERIATEYAGHKNFYALAYDQDEVIDSGMRGNDARFINHGCDPNLEVRKYQTLGDGLEEYEIGMWALRDIKKGDELFYNYNFDWFGEVKDSLRAPCRCGAANCIGYLGRKAGEKSGKEVALEIESKKAAEAARNVARARKGQKSTKTAAKKTTVKFSSAVERAKQTLASRTTKAAAKASRPLEPAEKEIDDASRAEEGEPEVDENPVSGGGVDEEQSMWEDVAMDTDAGQPTDAVDSVDDTTLVMNEEEVDELEEDDDTLMDASKPGQQTSKGKSKSAPLSSLPPVSNSRQALAQEIAEASRQVREESRRAISSLLPNGDDPSHQPDDMEEDPSASVGPSDSAGSPTSSAAAAAAAKRKSGWSNWLRKIAAEKPRTLEEWHEERMKRRRGIAWMNMMIAEFGVAPSPTPHSTESYSDGRRPAGSVGSFANTLAAQGHGPGPEGVRNLGGPKNKYRSDNWKKTKEEQMKHAWKDASGSPVGGSGTDELGSHAGDSSHRLSTSLSPTKRHADTPTQAEGSKRGRHYSSGREWSYGETDPEIDELEDGAMDEEQDAGEEEAPALNREKKGQETSGPPYTLVDQPAPPSTARPSWKTAAQAPTWKVESSIPGGGPVVLPPSTFTPPTNSPPRRAKTAMAAKAVREARRTEKVAEKEARATERAPRIGQDSSSSTPSQKATSSAPASGASQTMPEHIRRPSRPIITGWAPSSEAEANQHVPVPLPPREGTASLPTPGSSSAREHPSSSLSYSSPIIGGPNLAQPAIVRTQASVNPTISSSRPASVRSSSPARQTASVDDMLKAGPPNLATPFTTSSDPIDPSLDTAADVEMPYNQPAGSVPAMPATPLTPANFARDAATPSAADGTPSSSSARGYSKDSQKKKAIAKRNGAPMGWMYEVGPVESHATRMGENPVDENLPRSARRARPSLLKEEALRAERA